MIQANELRIGNKLLTNLKSIHTVCQIQFEHNNVVNEECWIIGDNCHEISLLDLHPIPLTPEILEKCGFEKERHYLVNGVICIFEGMQLALCPTEGREEINLPHIKYLHQLQNLHFVLTGEELAVTL